MKLLYLDCSVEDMNKVGVVRKKRNYARDLAPTLSIDVTLGSGL